MPGTSTAEARQRRRAHLTPAMLDQLRRRLDEELAERRTAVADHEAAAPESGVDRELADVLAARNADALVEVEAAIARLDDGTYGDCERCGAAIPFERLEAMPGARRCVACPESHTGSLFG